MSFRARARPRSAYLEHSVSTALFLLVAACEPTPRVPPTQWNEPRAYTSVTPASTAEPAARDAGTDANPATPAYGPPPPVAMPSAPLADRGGTGWPQTKLPTPRRIGHGGVVGPGIPSPARVAIAAANKGMLLDARTGDVLARMPTAPRNVSPRAGVVTLEGNPPRLVRLRDAQVITPALQPAGKAYRDVTLAASPQRDRPIALARGKDGEKLVGLPDADLSTFRLQATPFEATGEHFGAVLNAFGGWQLFSAADRMISVGTPFTMPHESACVRARLSDDGIITCLEYLPGGGMRQLRWMDNGWFVNGSLVSHVGWRGQGVEISGLLGGSCDMRSTRDAPPRVLFTCHRSKLAGVWTPEAVHTFPSPRDPNDIGGLLGADSGVVVPVFEDRRTEPEKAAGWVDLRAPRLWSSPDLVPLAIAAFAGVRERTLAEVPGTAAARDVILLDFDKGTRELVARVTDCPGGLGELADDDGRGLRWLVLACMTPPKKHTVARTLVWTEIIDTERRARWRTPLLPEVVFKDGVVVLSSRRALAAETAAAPSDLFSIDLASATP